MGRKALPVGRDGSRCLPGEPGRVGRPYWWVGIGLEVSHRAGRDWEALPECRDGSEGPPSGPGWVEMPSWRAGMGREALPE